MLDSSLSASYSFTQISHPARHSEERIPVVAPHGQHPRFNSSFAKPLCSPQASHILPRVEPPSLALPTMSVIMATAGYDHTIRFVIPSPHISMTDRPTTYAGSGKRFLGYALEQFSTQTHRSTVSVSPQTNVIWPPQAIFTSSSTISNPRIPILFFHSKVIQTMLLV